MPNSPICTNLRASLETLRSLKQDFHIAYDSAVSSGTPEDVQKVQDLKHLLETQTRELQKSVNKLEAEHLYDLKAQYKSQVTLLQRTGLIATKINIDETGKVQEVFCMRDIHGNEYPVPSYETLVEHLAEQKELRRTKADQGFTKFLLVPFGMSLDQMIHMFRAYLLNYKKVHPEFGRTDPSVPDESDQPNWDPLLVWGRYIGADVNGTLVYDPMSFEKEHHGGVTKTQILERQKTDQDTIIGWRILFLQGAKDGEGFRGIPRNGQGGIDGEQIPRADLEAGKSPRKYLAHQQTTSSDPTSPYYGESGMTPEEWIVMFMNHLAQTGKPIDDYQNKTDSVALLTGAYFTVFNNISVSNWSRRGRGARFNGYGPVDVDKECGVRCAVRG